MPSGANPATAGNERKTAEQGDENALAPGRNAGRHSVDGVGLVVLELGRRQRRQVTAPLLQAGEHKDLADHAVVRQPRQGIAPGVGDVPGIATPGEIVGVPEIARQHVGRAAGDGEQRVVQRPLVAADVLPPLGNDDAAVAHVHLVRPGRRAQHVAAHRQAVMQRRDRAVRTKPDDPAVGQVGQQQVRAVGGGARRRRQVVIDRGRGPPRCRDDLGAGRCGQAQHRRGGQGGELPAHRKPPVAENRKSPS